MLIKNSKVHIQKKVISRLSTKYNVKFRMTSCLVIIIMIYHSVILKNSYQIMTVEYVTWRSVLPAKSISLLPPATKLGQGYIFTGICHSVNREGVPGLGVCLVQGGCLVRGVPGLKGCLVLGGSAPGGSAPGGVPGGDPPKTTAVGGTYPTGMHSCLIIILCRDIKFLFNKT